MDVTGWCVYTDGSCYPNPGPSAGGWLVFKPGDPDEFTRGSRFYGRGTNQTAEIFAAVNGLMAVPKGQDRVTVYTDSKYVVNTMMLKYRRKKNKPAWNALDQAVDRHGQVDFYWVKGHAGDKYNEIVDQLAGDCRKKHSQES